MPRAAPAARPHLGAVPPPPAPRSWIPGAEASAFPLTRLPLGVRRRPDGSHAVCTRVSDRVADLRVLAEIGVYDDTGASRTDFAEASLNRLLARGEQVLAAVRKRTTACLDDDPNYWDLRQRAEIFLLPHDRVRAVLPVDPGDYTRLAPAPATGALQRREARAAHLLVEGGRDAELADGFGGVRERVGRLGFGLVLGSAEGGAFAFGALGLTDWWPAGKTSRDELAAGRRTLVAAWVTPLEAYGGGDLPLAARLRGGGHAIEGEVARTRLELPVDALLASLRSGGTLTRAGDLYALPGPPLAPPADVWIAEDLPRVRADAWAAAATLPPA